MRITERNRFESPKRHLDALRQQMADASAEVSTGLRVRKPSDDPMAARRVQDLDQRIARLEAHQRAAERADGRLRSTDGVLDEIVALMDKAKVLGLEGANDSINDQDAALIAEELTSLIAQIQDLANTKDSDGYLFAGALGDTAPVDDALAVRTDDRALMVEASEGIRVPTGLLAAEVFGDGTPATTQVFDTLVAMRDAVAARDQAGLDTALGAMDDATEQIIEARGTAGVHLGRVTGALSILDRLSANLPIERAEVVEADLVEAINALSRAESMFEASLAATGRTVGGQTLLDYL